ncbi:hypothetical protein A8709_16130 [Paenibacillus pectinilyticus]|uniref:Uncharacterized protein n=1 Tax=Paenibacillus pectinilyticus TaxID=512399 RepID=A0A1C1A4Y8_9BACL|nr:hypothetical protein [Paenibacillus pectinilyticus]OCT15596.1 hypothetical protein A8709_16130 [Paenibacillus pectinilyticus]
MDYAFNIQPAAFTRFDDESELLDQCKEWGLVSEKATKAKIFYYKGNNLNVSCSIVGLVDPMTAVIEFETQQLHCIHPSYLKEMQAANYTQRGALLAEEGAVAEDAEAEPEEKPAKVKAAKVETVAEDSEAEAPKKAPAAPKVKKEKAPKLELPEEKVKMKATITEFTTVPNNFSDTDDEVIIYEAVSILDPALDVGTAWSSHSATLKKLELAIGDTVTFECKIVAKKLSKHPVPYKINNPGKMQKVTE